MDAHEAEVARLRAFYDQRMKVYFGLENWTQLWDQFVEFEKRANDPNRFSKRGGGLLQVKRERKRQTRTYGRTNTPSPKTMDNILITTTFFPIFKEEKERKKFAAKLPKCEKLLEEEISTWERENGGEFLVMGLKLTDYIESVRQQYESEKQQVVFFLESMV